MPKSFLYTFVKTQHMSDIIDFIKSFRKLSKQEQKNFAYLTNYLSEKELKTLRTLYKQRLVGLEFKHPALNDYLKIRSVFPKVTTNSGSAETKKFVSFIQDKFNRHYREKIVKPKLSGNPETFQELIAPNIVGMDLVKKAAAIQLFSEEPFHILLLGDPGTGKTDILRSAHDFSPVSSFGLGSGTSAVGLAVTVKGKEIQK